MDNSKVTMDYKSHGDDVWLVETSGKYVTAIKDYLIGDGIPEPGADKIIQNAAAVLGYCPKPGDEKDSQGTGIVIGKVQSGKTSNFIALTALAFDNGYTHVVVFGGTKNILVSQNSDRIKEYFAATSSVIVLNTTDHKSQLNAKTIEKFIEMGKKIIIVALKSSGQISYIRDNVFDDDVVRSYPTLIIDDEGDEASLNTLVKKGKKSSTYKAIESLKYILPKHCFVSVTATPQANILIDTMDQLSPDFGVLVDPGKGYCGLDVFHSPDSKYTVEIPDDEGSLLDAGVPASFYTALSMFFVACGIFEARGRKEGDKLSMLVHPSQKKVDHHLVKNKIDTIVESWKDLAANKDDIGYAQLGNRLKSAYDRYISDGTQEVPDFNTVEDKALLAIQYCGLHIVNGDSVPNGADDFYDFNIYVGGAMLGRGITLKGLAITYIIRTSKGVSNVDTVQQRARWFGYKTKYLDLCRIYAVKKIIREFRDIREHEEDLWQTVRDANLEGTHFKDIARIFLLSDGLNMTRKSVAETERGVFKPWNEQRVFQNSTEYASSNRTIIRQFKEKHEAELDVKTFGTGAPFSILPNFSYTEVVAELVDKLLFPAESKLNKEFFHKVARLMEKKGIDGRVDVIWMRDHVDSEGNEDTSLHKIIDNAIPNYMVGRRPQDNNKPVTYKGDKYQFVKVDTMQLQIHNIQDEITGLISPAVALYIPKTYIEKLTNLVIRS